VNVWAIGHDPKVWKRPLEFDLNQVFGLDINVGGSNYNLLPFGSGHQRCPGLDLAQLMVQCGLATILHAFDLFLKPNVKLEDMNMMEDVGATSPLVEPLIVVAKPHLPIEIYK
jgi:coumaroylquinate(coumaroylshikimate) 3'-monooxygenase